MGLPQVNAPEYRLELPSTDEEILFRPFLVKEEKLLLIAQETGDETSIINAVKNIVQSCIINEDIDVSTMALFDLEYIFLNLRAKSVGETAKLKVKCPDDEKTMVEVEVFLPDVKVVVGEGHTNRIELTKDMLLEEHWQKSYPMLLRQAGYRTAIAGKVGFVVKPNSGGKPDLPVADFDKWGGGPGQTNYKTIKNKSMVAYAGKYPHSSRSYGAFGRDFILESVKSEKPYCLSISFKATRFRFSPLDLKSFIFNNI